MTPRDHELIVATMLTVTDALQQLSALLQPDDVPSGTATPPPSAAIAPPPLATAATGPSVPLDSEGLPWDSRIHASTKNLTKSDGRWKKRRKVPAETVVAIEAELRAALVAPPPPAAVAAAVAPPPPAAVAAAVAPPPPAAVAAAVAPPPPAAVAAAVAPPPPAAVAAAVAPPPPVAGSSAEFVALASAIVSSGVTNDRIQSALAAVGLQTLNALAVRADLVPYITSTLFPEGLPNA